MIERRWGRVINIASIQRLRFTPSHGAAYAASKHALVGLTKVAAIEAVEHGVTANAICPAATRSVLNDRRIQYDSDRLGVGVEAFERGLTPLGRRLEPDEIASLAVYLASDEAGAINGQSINVCGGKVFALETGRPSPRRLTPRPDWRGRRASPPSPLRCGGSVYPASYRPP